MEHLILQKSADMFLSKGFKSVTMDDIAAEMAISKKTIYQYFSSKPELIETTIGFIQNQVIKELYAIITKDYDAITELIVAHRHLDEIFKIKNSSAVYQLQKYYPKIAQKIKLLQLQEFENIIKENLRKGVREKLYRKDLNIDYQARFYFASSIILDDIEYFPENEFDCNQIHQMHLEYHLRSISTPEGITKLQDLINNKRNNE